MKRVLIAVGVMVALLVPLTAAAKVTKTDKHNARVECKALLKAAGKKNFARLMHTSKRKAYGLCKKRKSREESRERKEAHSQAVQECREEMVQRFGGAPGSPEWVKNNDPPRNEFGKCVSEHARDNKDDMDDHDDDVINAAAHCRRDHGNGLEHNEEWADSIKGHNAFGKCVSWHARHPHNNNNS